MQVARSLARPRYFSSANMAPYNHATLTLMRRPELRYSENRFRVAQGTSLQPYFSRLISTIITRGLQLRLRTRTELTSTTGRNFCPGWICGLAVGSTCLTKLSGLAEVAHLSNDERIRKPPSEFYVEWNNRLSQLVHWIRRLWIPSLCVVTISLGLQYPVSLLANVLFLMWSTKPSPSSIHVWVEQKREREASEKRGLDRVKAHVSGLLEASAVMHVEVRDHKIFCLARVSSLTKRSTLIGILGDWWVIYSSTSAIHTGVNMRSLIGTVPPFVIEQFSMT